MLWVNIVVLLHSHTKARKNVTKAISWLFLFVWWVEWKRASNKRVLNERERERERESTCAVVYSTTCTTHFNVFDIKFTESFIIFFFRVELISNFSTVNFVTRFKFRSSRQTFPEAILVHNQLHVALGLFMQSNFNSRRTRIQITFTKVVDTKE